MRYTVQLTQGQTCGQIPVKNQQGEIVYILKGNLNEFNQPIILTDINHIEIGRLYLDSNLLLTSYSVDVVNHSLVKVKKINSRFANLFYITRLNYWIKGSLKQGRYSFYSGIKKVASVCSLVTDAGLTWSCDISRPEDVPFIILISLLFTQWHTKPLFLPTFNFQNRDNALS